jgi:hypothetical protein
MDFETAKVIVDTYEDAIRRVWGLLNLESRCSPEEFALLKREIGRIASAFDTNVYPIVLEQYPQLDPLKNRG